MYNFLNAVLSINFSYFSDNYFFFLKARNTMALNGFSFLVGVVFLVIEKEMERVNWVTYGVTLHRRTILYS